MPRGGARPNAGRKPKPLSQKIAEGNPGKRPLKKVEFANTAYDPSTPPEYLRELEKQQGSINPITPMDIYREVIEYLEPTGCLHQIPKMLIREHVMANYNAVQAHYELAGTGNVGKNSKGDMVVSGFADIMLKMQKRVEDTWRPIWDILARSSERVIDNPEFDLFSQIFGSRVRNKTGS